MGSRLGDPGRDTAISGRAESADAVIIGGGVMGCALAYQLSRRGLDVVLFERDGLGSGSTSKNAGGIRQQFSTEVNVQIQMLGVRLLGEFEDEIGTPCDFHQHGYLFLLSRPEDVESFRGQLRMWHRLGLAEARWVTPAEAQAMVPGLLTGDLLGGTFCPTDGIASPDAVCRGYAAAARRRGARLHEGVAVTGIDVRADTVTGVRTADGRVAAPVVINCSGPWSEAVGRMAGVEVPVKPHRRHVFVTGTFPAIARTAPFTIDFASSFYFHPEGDGVLFGRGDRDDPPTFATDIDPDFTEKVMEAAMQRLPALAEAAIKTSWAGLYEVTPDHQAILGPAGRPEGFWNACGFSGHGFMQAPPVALLLAQLLVDGHSDVDLEPFSLGRFRKGGLRAERNVI